MYVKNILFLLVIFLIFFASVAMAQKEQDYYIEERISGQLSSNSQTVNDIVKSWISGQKMKQTSKGGQEIIIYRADQGKAYLINPVQKAYIEIPLSEMRQMTEKALSTYVPVVDGKLQVPDKLYEQTDETKKIGPWTVRKMKVLTGQKLPEIQSETGMWFAENSGFDNSILIRVFKVTMGGQVSPEMKKLFDKMTNLPGYPIQVETTTTYRNQTFSTTKTVIKIEKKMNIDPMIFDVPSEYTKVEKPQAPMQ